MFEIIGYWLLRIVGLRKKTNDEVFGSLYLREEGPTEFIVGFVTCFVVIGLAMTLGR